MLARQPAGVSNELFSAANVFARTGQIPNQDEFRTTRKRYWHRKLYDGAAEPTSLTFFDAGKSKWITNLNNGQLSNNSIFLMTGIRIDSQTNITLATGAVIASSAGVQSIYGTAPSGIPATQAQDLLTVFTTGLFTCTVGNAIIADVYGLQAFPAGGGLSASVAFGGVDSDLTAGAFSQTALVTNGVPDARNVTSIPRYPVVPSTDVKATIEWQAAHNVTNDIIIMVTLDGTLIEQIRG